MVGNRVRTFVLKRVGAKPTTHFVYSTDPIASVREVYMKLSLEEYLKQLDPDIPYEGDTPPFCLL